MGQQLRSLLVLVEDLGSVPNTPVVDCDHSGYGDLMLSAAVTFVGIRNTCGIHINM